MPTDQAFIKGCEIIADGLYEIARKLQLLGNGDAYSGPVPIGAIEGLAIRLGEKLDDMSMATSEIASAIREHNPE